MTFVRLSAMLASEALENSPYAAVAQGSVQATLDAR